MGTFPFHAPQYLSGLWDLDYQHRGRNQSVSVLAESDHTVARKELVFAGFDAEEQFTRSLRRDKALWSFRHRRSGQCFPTGGVAIGDLCPVVAFLKWRCFASCC